MCSTGGPMADIDLKKLKQKNTNVMTVAILLKVLEKKLFAHHVKVTM